MQCVPICVRSLGSALDWTPGTCLLGLSDSFDKNAALNPRDQPLHAHTKCVKHHKVQAKPP